MNNIDRTNNDIEFDRNHIWHPYTSMTAPLPAHCVESAEGVRIRLTNGKSLIDGMSSWWSVIHGYNNPVLNSAVTEQLGKMSHVMFGGLTHKPAIELCRLLTDITPQGLNHVFLADSGSVSVEVAMKMAIQYWNAKGKPEKHKMLTVLNGYHGDTFGAMSVCDPVNGMHTIFEGVLAKNIFTEAPRCSFEAEWNEEYIAEMKEIIKQRHNEIAAVIIEPIVQGAGGMRIYSPYYLKRLRELCDEHNVLLIADEIATGFGRTGKLFACEWADITPDIMCVGKAITGGYMTLAASIATTEVAEGISSEGGVFMHGPTFMGNPLACATAVASIKLLFENNWKEKLKKIESRLKDNLSAAMKIEGVEEVRVLGAIGVIELKEPVDMQIIQKMFVEEGVWVRPFGKLVYIMPPYVITEEELHSLTTGMLIVIKKYLEN